MVPAHFVFLDRLPLTSNGKIDRNALPAAFGSGQIADPASSTDERPHNEIERIIVRVWAEALGVANIDLEREYLRSGCNFADGARSADRTAGGRLDREIPLVDLFEFHTVSSLAAHLAGRRRRAERVESCAPPSCRAESAGVIMKTSAIAIVGMAGRFPGARNVDEFWRNLRDGVESIRPLSDAELLAAGATPEELDPPRLCEGRRGS